MTIEYFFQGQILVGRITLINYAINALPTYSTFTNDLFVTECKTIDLLRKLFMEWYDGEKKTSC